MSEVEAKMDKVKNLVEVKKLEEACDADCQAKCDKDADEMIREMKNPLNNITWNCKNNYVVYTTDYDPDHSHFDRIASDVMDVQRTLWQIKHLEEKQKKPWSWQQDERDTDFAVLKELKKQLGLPEGFKMSGSGYDGIDIASSIDEAVAEHAKPGNSNNGFTKGHGFV